MAADRLFSLKLFCEVAAGRSFSHAAQRLGISKATVTKHVAALEKSIGAQLILRTTRQVRLTEAGGLLFESTLPLLRRFDDLETEVRSLSKRPEGEIRIGAPPALGAFLTTPIAAFVRQQSNIRVTMTLDTGDADLLREGLDLSIRISYAPEDSSLIGFHMTSMPQFLVASPSYLQGRERPTAPEHLASHDCLVHMRKAPTNFWHFEGPSGPRTVRVRGSIRSNFGESLRQASLLGLGLSIHPHYMIAKDVEAGALEIVLPEYRPPPVVIVAVAPGRQLALRVRLFVNFMKIWFRRNAPAHPGMAARSSR